MSKLLKKLKAERDQYCSETTKEVDDVVNEIIDHIEAYEEIGTAEEIREALEAKIETVRGIREEEQEAILNANIIKAIEGHGCLTGDCPHDTKNECYMQLINIPNLIINMKKEGL